MKLARTLVLALTVGLLLAGGAQGEDERSCRHPVGWKPKASELGPHANLCNAYLRAASLPRAMLYQSDLSTADLHAARLPGAMLFQSDLSGTDLSSAGLQGASLLATNLSSGNLLYADLSRADLSGADLFEANLFGAVLVGANLYNANLAGARLAYANLDEARYQPVGQPPNPFVAGIRGLSTVTFDEGREDGLVQLRKLLIDGGLRELEREATYAIERNRTQHLLAKWPDEPFRAFEGLMHRIGFEWTTAYGLHPGWALFWIIGVWLALTPVYAWAIWRSPHSRKPGGIYQIFPKDRIEFRGLKVSGDNALQVARLRRRDFRALGWGAYFSLLSAFHIGFREFSVGTWLSRIQPQEFQLEPVGWVHTVSGIQSLISVYLLAMWVLTYFGRPFG